MAPLLGANSHHLASRPSFQKPPDLTVTREIGLSNFVLVIRYYIEDSDYYEDITVNRYPQQPLNSRLQPPLTNLKVEREILNVNGSPILRYYVEDLDYNEDITVDHRPLRPFRLPGRFLLPSMDEDDIQRSIYEIYSQALNTQKSAGMDTPYAQARSFESDAEDLSWAGFFLQVFGGVCFFGALYYMVREIWRVLTLPAETRCIVARLQSVPRLDDQAPVYVGHGWQQPAPLYHPDDQANWQAPDNVYHDEPNPQPPVVPQTSWWDLTTNLLSLMLRWLLLKPIAFIYNSLRNLITNTRLALDSPYRTWLYHWHNFWYHGRWYIAMRWIGKIFSWRFWLTVFIGMVMYSAISGPDSPRARHAEDLRRYQPWDLSEYGPAAYTITVCRSQTPMLSPSSLAPSSPSSFDASSPITSESSSPLSSDTFSPHSSDPPSTSSSASSTESSSDSSSSSSSSYSSSSRKTLPITLLTPGEDHTTSPRTLFSRLTRDPWRPRAVTSPVTLFRKFARPAPLPAPAASSAAAATSSGAGQGAGSGSAAPVTSTSETSRLPVAGVVPGKASPEAVARQTSGARVTIEERAVDGVEETMAYCTQCRQKHCCDIK